MNTKLDPETLKNLRKAFERTAFGPHDNFRQTSRRGLMYGYHLPKRENVVDIRVIAMVVAGNLLADDDAHAVIHEVVEFVSRHRIRLCPYIAGFELGDVPVKHGKPEWPDSATAPFSMDPESISASLRKLHPNVYNFKPLVVLIGEEAFLGINFHCAAISCIKEQTTSPDPSSKFSIRSHT